MAQLAIVFLVLLFIGVPIAFAAGIAGLIGVYMEGIPLVNAVRKMFTQVDMFILLAAPFYILAGDLMNRGGISERLIRLTLLVVGRIRGGMAYANVLASVVFAGISGTAIADTAALGKIFIPNMEKEGYRREFAAAVTVASALIGPIVPPSVIMLIYAAINNVSVIQLFIAGVVPGLMLGAACVAVILWKGRTEKYPKTKIDVAAREIPMLARDGILVMSIPLFIVFGTLFGVFTPSEAGGVAVIYAIFLGLFVFRHLGLSGLFDSLKSSARTSGALFIAISCGGIINYVLTISGTANQIAQVGNYFEGAPTLFLLFVILFLFLIGFFIDSGKLVIIVAPLLAPIALNLGVNPYQFAMVFLLAGNVSLITPPVGVVLFVGARIGEVPVLKLFRAVWPFVVAEMAVVILIAIFPGLTLWLLRVAGLQ